MTGSNIVEIIDVPSNNDWESAKPLSVDTFNVIVGLAERYINRLTQQYIARIQRGEALRLDKIPRGVQKNLIIHHKRIYSKLIMPGIPDPENKYEH